MHAHCPACCSHIPAGDINVAADTAICRRCGHATAYSAVIHAPAVGLYTCPPDGCHIEQLGDRWRATASTAGWMFFVLAPFALIWNSFVSVFVIGALMHLPGGLAILAFMSLHIGAGVYMAWTAACYACGTVEVELTDRQIRVSTGIGPLRRWQERELEYMRELGQKTRTGSRGGSWTELVLEGAKPLRFGSMLSDERRQFLHAAIAAELLKRRGA